MIPRQPKIVNRTFGPLLIAGAFMLVPSTLRAQDNATARKKAAQELYITAQKQTKAGQFELACPNLENARALLPHHLRTSISLAECYRAWDKPANAYELYQVVRKDAVEQGEIDKVKEIDSALKVLDPQIARITISLPASVHKFAKLAILRNSVPILEEQWNAAIPVNPGKIELVVTAQDQQPWSISFELKKGESKTVEIVPPWQLPTDKPPTVDTSPPPPRVKKLISPMQTPPPPSSSPLRTAGFVGINVGVVGLGVGAILGGIAWSKNSASKEPGRCDANNVCADPNDKQLRLDAISFGNGSTAAFVIGGVLLGGGIILVAASPKGKTNDRSSAPQTSLFVGPSGVAVRGSW